MDCSTHCRGDMSNNLVLMAAVLIAMMGIGALVRAFTTSDRVEVERRE